MFIVFFLLSQLYARDHLLVKFDDNVIQGIQKFLVSKWQNGALVYYVPERVKSSFIDKNFVLQIRRLITGKFTPGKDNISELDKWYIVTIDTSMISIDEAYSYLKHDKNVVCVEYDYLYPVSNVPDDPYVVNDYYSGQWYLFKIEALKAWNYTEGDSTIFVGAVDSGVDFDHEDIVDNLYINPGEDINHNGRFDVSDINGSDDDGDGYVDNIIGWDFMSNDWDPTPDGSEGSEHGTHVFGIASASTNNGLGIAGIGWKVKGMAFRCGTGQYIYISAAVNAIHYAADRGVKVLNFSWGGYDYNQSVVDAVNYAFDHGVVMTAAASNDAIGYAAYPAGYNHVIGVGATDLNDHKTDFSNYGPGVDIMAPGSNIISTLPNDAYGALDGTSMAAPVVMGVAALVRSLKPEFSPADVESVLIWSADPIDSVNPDSLWGKLGAGRVDAYKALSLLVKSDISVIGDSIVDGNDGQPSMGETVEIYPLLSNKLHWQDASDITIKIDSVFPNGYVIVEDSVARLSSLPDGEEQYCTDPFVVSIIDTHSLYIKFHLTITSTPENFKTHTTHEILINYPYVLIVDDNHYNEPYKNFSHYYESALKALNIGYEKISTPLIHSLRFDSIKYVIWFTSDDSTEVLTQDEKDSIISFLNAGGNIILSSQYVCEKDTDFILQYFGDSVGDLAIPQRYIRSDSLALADGIIDTLSFRITGSGGADNDYSIDKLIPVYSRGIFHYVLPTGSGYYGEAATFYTNGTFKSILIPWPIEAIDDNAAGKNTRSDVLRTLLNLLGMNISKVKENRSSKNSWSKDKIRPFYVIFSDGLSAMLSQSIFLNNSNFKVYGVDGTFIAQARLHRNKMIFSRRLRRGVYYIVPSKSDEPIVRLLVH